MDGTKYHLILKATDPFGTPVFFDAEFLAFPTASCTLAQHYASKIWYEMQEDFDKCLAEAKEASPE